MRSYPKFLDGAQEARLETHHFEAWRRIAASAFITGVQHPHQGVRIRFRRNESGASAFGQSPHELGGCSMPIAVLTVRVDEQVRIDGRHTPLPA